MAHLTEVQKANGLAQQTKAYRNARAAHRALIAVLGGKCAQETRRCKGALQVDHVEGIHWDRSRFSFWQRVAMYWAELFLGVPLQPLCLFHNGAKNQWMLERRLERDPGYAARQLAKAN